MKALSLTPFFARSLTLVPRSLLLNRKETLATQASFLAKAEINFWCIYASDKKHCMDTTLSKRH